MDVLAQWAEHDPTLADWLAVELRRLTADPRKSVAKRATKHLSKLTG
jgi:hypothetical protein